MAASAKFDEAVVKQIEDKLKTMNEYNFETELVGKIGLPERVELAQRGIIIKHDTKQKPCIAYKRDGAEGVTGSVPALKKAPKAKREIQYVQPEFTSEIKAMLNCATDWVTNRSVNVRFVGPHGSGKTELAGILQSECGFAKIFQINGHADMDSSYFIGEKTVVVDEKSGQNFIKYQKGILELAMTEGLLKDENGDVILDKDGKVQVTGAPAILFVDEYAAIPEHISIVLNRVMEIPREGQSRRIELATDKARKVFSHPGFVVILSGNTMGKGCETAKTSGYTAQDIQQDDSLLDRISATFFFGYNLEAEKIYMEDALDDEYQVGQFMKFVETIRKCFIEEKVMTLMSTRAIVNICALAKSYKKNKVLKPLETAIYRSIFSGLREVEKNAWSEVLIASFGYDVRTINKKNANTFYV